MSGYGIPVSMAIRTRLFVEAEAEVPSTFEGKLPVDPSLQALATEALKMGSDAESVGLYKDRDVEMREGDEATESQEKTGENKMEVERVWPLYRGVEKAKHVQVLDNWFIGHAIDPKIFFPSLINRTWRAVIKEQEPGSKMSSAELELLASMGAQAEDRTKDLLDSFDVFRRMYWQGRPLQGLIKDFESKSELRKVQQYLARRLKRRPLLEERSPILPMQ
ncbi:MAG: hypothetical protein M4579_000169 [Chaenotheca gracillima]|nr:MAG: hypothetical protein M4579_000169 [Chaenotheca gracillima]